MNRRTLPLYGMLTPYLLGTLVLILIPAVISVALAFTNYDAFSPPTWAALENFTFIFQYRAFIFAAQNTILFLVLAVPLRILAMLALAMLFNRPRRRVKVYRVAIYLPTVIPDVAYALLWMWIFNPLYGPINAILNVLGLPAPAWMVDR